MQIEEYIESGIIEAYVMGVAEIDEITELLELAATNQMVSNAISVASAKLENFHLTNVVEPNKLVRPMFLATVNYTNRMMAGEEPTYPPVLSSNSTINHFESWLSRPDMSLPNDFQDIHARIIGYTPAMTTAIVWIKEMAPHEVHDDEYEQFLILEGTCEITIGTKVHQLAPGDYLQIPLYESHFVKVTSTIPCKVILQRIAA